MCEADSKDVWLEEEIVHIPVMVKEVMEYLCVSRDGVYLDCTVGTGGHAYNILSNFPNAMVIGIDWDEEALNIAEKRLHKFQGRYYLRCENYTNAEKVLDILNIEYIDGILLDLGVSKHQLSDVTRGFSFQREGNLDMRMSKKLDITAEHILNTYTLKELVNIFNIYGEERYAPRISKNICREREKYRISKVSQLVNIILSSVPRKKYRIHPATRVFQALRIAVNNELENLKIFLTSNIFKRLKVNRRIAIISFHSLEDRIVKNFFRDLEFLEVVSKKPLTPSAEEVRNNPSARSAKLRVAEKVQ
jgi:16S rRNA (cytosine1402-N4)-methyltransferase